MDTDHDVIMCREVLVSKPYKFKPRTPERGQSWESVAQQLNSIHQLSFRVTAGTESFVVFFKDGCLTFSFPAKSETISPVFHGCETSLSSSLSSMLKFPNRFNWTQLRVRMPLNTENTGGTILQSFSPYVIKQQPIVLGEM